MYDFAYASAFGFVLKDLDFIGFISLCISTIHFGIFSNFCVLGFTEYT